MDLRTDLTLWFELAVRLLAAAVALAQRTSGFVVDRLESVGATSLTAIAGWSLLTVGAVTLVVASASALRRRG